jgi:hypothetical protein
LQARDLVTAQNLHDTALIIHDYIEGFHEGLEEGYVFPVAAPAGFQNSATGPVLGFYAARSYSLIRPPRTGQRWIRSGERSAAG